MPLYHRRDARAEVVPGRRRAVRRLSTSALGYSKEAYDYLVENVKIGAERAGRDWNDARHRRLVRDHLRDPTRRRRRRAARTMVAFYISAMPDEQLERARHRPRRT